MKTRKCRKGKHTEKKERQEMKDRMSELERERERERERKRERECVCVSVLIKLGSKLGRESQIERQKKLQMRIKDEKHTTLSQ